MSEINMRHDVFSQRRERKKKSYNVIASGNKSQFVVFKEKICVHSNMMSSKYLPRNKIKVN